MGKRGQKYRPCWICGEIINFVIWQEESARRKRKIHHWANQDGSHHVHKEETIKKKPKRIKKIPKNLYDGDIPPWDDSLGEFRS